jgi:hypothetical protein
VWVMHEGIRWYRKGAGGTWSWRVWVMQGECGWYSTVYSSHDCIRTYSFDLTKALTPITPITALPSRRPHLPPPSTSPSHQSRPHTRPIARSETMPMHNTHSTAIMWIWYVTVRSVAVLVNHEDRRDLHLVTSRHILAKIKQLFSSQRTLDSRLQTLDSGLLNLDFRLWTLESRL